MMELLGQKAFDTMSRDELESILLEYFRKACEIDLDLGTMILNAETIGMALASKNTYEYLGKKE